MKFKLDIAHQVPGRIRLKANSAKRNPAILDHIKQLFVAIPGVESVAVNTTTGSLILHYDPTQHVEVYKNFQARYASHALPASTSPATEIDAAVNTIEEEAEFLASRSLMARTVVDFCKTVDQYVRVASDNTVDLKIIVAASFSILALMEIGVTASTPLWVTLAIFALNHLAELNLPVRPIV
jgi:Zn-dependent membrane protease YugP